MAEHVFFADKSDEKVLKQVLEKDPYARDSFVQAGYTLRDSSVLGLPAGKFVLYFKCEDSQVGKKLEERLKEVPSAKHAPNDEKAAVIQKINEKEDAAAEGFGQLFG